MGHADSEPRVDRDDGESVVPEAPPRAGLRRVCGVPAVPRAADVPSINGQRENRVAGDADFRPRVDRDDGASGDTMIPSPALIEGRRNADRGEAQREPRATCEGAATSARVVLICENCPP
ncbi:hypothetical protein JCM18882A_33400 [Brevibacterium metallidurans]|uniref:Uncharacterized protein n=1 Tax=Brevibacterium metallidurans TaxID=1482676 RepID=A0ABP3CBT1_9MICO